ncbi:MAG: hypothetical protein HFJ28_06215 [Clostridia bacterium]|jgi:hypothetical protein|nr:hypothetical protein [Clostridia bacterium]
MGKWVNVKELLSNPKTRKLIEGNYVDYRPDCKMLRYSGKLVGNNLYSYTLETEYDMKWHLTLVNDGIPALISHDATTDKVTVSKEYDLLEIWRNLGYILSEFGRICYSNLELGAIGSNITRTIFEELNHDLRHTPKSHYWVSDRLAPTMLQTSYVGDMNRLYYNYLGKNCFNSMGIRPIVYLPDDILVYIEEFNGEFEFELKYGWPKEKKVLKIKRGIPENEILSKEGSHWVNIYRAFSQDEYHKKLEKAYIDYVPDDIEYFIPDDLSKVGKRCCGDNQGEAQHVSPEKNLGWHFAIVNKNPILVSHKTTESEIGVASVRSNLGSFEDSNFAYPDPLAVSIKHRSYIYEDNYLDRPEFLDFEHRLHRILESCGRVYSRADLGAIGTGLSYNMLCKLSSWLQRTGTEYWLMGREYNVVEKNGNAAHCLITNYSLCCGVTTSVHGFHIRPMVYLPYDILVDVNGDGSTLDKPLKIKRGSREAIIKSSSRIM